VDSDSHANHEPAAAVFGGVGMFLDFDNVLSSDQTYQAILRINQGQFLDTVLKQLVARLFQGFAMRGGHQPGTRSHHLSERQVCMRRQQNIAMGDQPQ
jgi:hypothetical protein